MVELCFGRTVNLSNNGGDSGGIGQGVAASGNDVYVVWRDNTPGSYDIFYRKVQMVEFLW